MVPPVEASTTQGSIASPIWAWFAVPSLFAFISTAGSLAFLYSQSSTNHVLTNADVIKACLTSLAGFAVALIASAWISRHLQRTLTVQGQPENNSESARQRVEAQIRRMHALALKDSATGLPSRQGLLAAANWEDEENILVILIGLHGMELVNNIFGPRTEQQALKAIAERLRGQCPADAIIARGNGPEFFVVQRDISKEHHDVLISKIRDIFSEAFATETEAMVINASLGIVECKTKGIDLEVNALGQASLALITAKERGISQRVNFDESLYQKASSRAQLARELKLAISQQELVLFFQPIINLTTKSLHGIEALVRWPHKTRGLVGPNEFIELAEESGMIIDLGTWVLARACSEVAKAMEIVSLPSDFTVHINISARQLMQADFTDQVVHILADNAFEAHTLTLEVSESVLIRQDSTIRGNIARLRELGVGLALDNFGAGNTSLADLSRLPFETLKIDRSFMLAAQKDHRSLAVLSAVIDVVAGAGVHSVAEGIETQEQARLVKELGCHYAQGYLFGRPAPLMQALASKTDILMNKLEPVTMPLVI
jgi:diguanylate cyclase (GGDEF)-like protein